MFSIIVDYIEHTAAACGRWNAIVQEEKVTLNLNLNLSQHNRVRFVVVVVVVALLLF